VIKLNRPPCPRPDRLAAHYKYPENKATLQAACHDKCMYCESKVSQVYFGDVEHIRPKARFPELEFEWTNLGFVCAKCNTKKGDQWSDETPLVDPFTDEPGDHFAAVGQFIFHRNGSERGEWTSAVVDLNRSDLLERRADRMNLIRALLDKANRSAEPELQKIAFREIEEQIATHQEYSMVCRRLRHN
jgi:CRISPR/Cas system Type II protein with McrA/HNH and RuvC-like nuclease domain